MWVASHLGVGVEVGVGVGHSVGVGPWLALVSVSRLSRSGWSLGPSYLPELS